MRLILHAGAHCTDGDRVLRTLLRNADDLRQSGTIIPKPTTYRRPLSAAINGVIDAGGPPDTWDDCRKTLACPGSGGATRLVLSTEHFFTVPKTAVRGDMIYPRAAERIKALHQIFAGSDIQLCLAIRNPGTWLPAVFAETPHNGFLDFLNGCDARLLRWSEMLGRVRHAAPDMPMTIWCAEDMPILWDTILRTLSGIPSATKLTGCYDLVKDLIGPDKTRSLRSYLRKRPGLSDAQRNHVLLAFLTEYADRSEVEEEITLPGWSSEFLATLTAQYEDDVEKIKAMPGVDVLAP